MQGCCEWLPGCCYLVAKVFWMVARVLHVVARWLLSGPNQKALHLLKYDFLVTLYKKIS